MAELSDEQKRFLREHRISPHSLFDATGMKHSEWKVIMKQEEKLFAFGVSPCKKLGHSLRDRSNHCIQCDTSNINFMRRYVTNGYVYVAATHTLRMLKIGSSQDTSDHERTINGFAYGGANDWTMIARVRCKNAGQVEFEVHSQLEPFLSPQTYFANGRTTRCREIFSAETLRF